MRWEGAFEILDSILPGETVLLEYTPSYIPEFVLKALLDYSKERNISVIIDDNFDALYTIATHARFLGINLDLEDVAVIKTGGREQVGNVVARVSFHPDAGVYIRNYEEASGRILEDTRHPAIDLVVGIENLFLFTRSPADSYQLILSIQRFLGNKWRKAFYLVNRDILESFPIAALAELERMATTVIEMTPYPDKARLKVKKSVNPHLMGRELDIDAGGLGI